MAEVTVTDSNFESEVLKSDIPVVVDFWAAWCAPCRIQDPILEELAKEFEGKVIIAKLNVDENPATAAKYGVMSIPTLMFFKKGSIIKQWIGVQSKETLAGEFNKIVS
ncbi:thioredoxin [Candidatus Gottesmanbacteria bacterium RIFCSPHIGHO2_02_FULL_39_14]|uniref:Thioredoxin n=3 Tax=Candidatus Gottesmaniibacteriota TaxID=1752720 RepID=A0A1F5ZUK5_9BACT|nr:MAG: thioredoxin [Candidatus Gottesmanbacteria bacterium RBG_16_38_7b]OGG15812.1 MAG: thioredoxin [Candidatus Gottesmanbacteria bacterium RIFCSPHIGHO2_02_FULL_39_14]OGG32356.1 MAG: thioredoxin [Candidatus Gottesmanbacteria bacterium RIFCSPLOWO2_02_FULL_38_8]